MTIFQLPGINMQIAGTNPRMQKAIENLFQMCPHTKSEVYCRLVVESIDKQKIYHLLPSWLLDETDKCRLSIDPQVIYGPNGQLAAVAMKDDLLFCCFTSPDEKTLHLLCCGDQHDDESGIILPVLIPLLREVLLKKQHFLLHSAAVICPNDIGILFVAVSGGGKTTTALSMLRNGAKLIADDLISLFFSQKRIVAQGFPKLLNLRENTIAFFDELRALPQSAFIQNGSSRQMISPLKVYGEDCLSVKCCPNYLFFLERSCGRPSISHLPLSEASKNLLLANSFSATQQITPLAVMKLLDTLAKVKFFKLNIGNDPVYLGSWLMDHISENQVF